MCSPRSSSVEVMLVGDFVDAGGDGVGDHGDVLTQIDLHAGDGVADLLGLADEVVALMGDVLQQRAHAHFVVAIGALERGDFVGDEGFQFAGARDGALDAVAHGGDFAADRLADGDHAVARHGFRLGHAHGDMGHRLRDHAQFLAARRHVGEEVEQQDRRGERWRRGRRWRAGRRALREHRAQRRQSVPMVNEKRADDPQRRQSVAMT